MSVVRPPPSGNKERASSPDATWTNPPVVGAHVVVRSRPPFSLRRVVARTSGLCSEKRKLQVNVASPIQCSMNGRKCTIVVEPKINQSQPDFTKSRSGYILAVPGN
ncbi:hypothetical protein F2P81_022667 [Scophthalmus maximus]|uniref:Uncharacterized protein n=1 Tax=Scophthalmus maximus TaxID=52904 RepID=A0A6A4RSY8_SCOMX|nr:hypothetical protein F2P81_022667 [Scophthalmus maximus]